MATENIKVVSFSDATFFSAIKSAHMTDAQVRAHSRAQYLFGYLSAIGAKTIVIEHKYTDGDYLDDFANYYVKSFADYERRTTRLHFFSASIGEDECINQLTLPGGAEDSFRASYLGFVVARPLPSAIVGRTVLKTYGSDGGRRNYHAIKPYASRLFGTRLEVESLAFQEQDTVLAACATVSLWSAFQKTAQLFGAKLPTPADITRSANSTVFEARPLPSRGLTLGQMTRAVRDVGLEPEVIQCGPQVPLISLIYSYLQLGVPIILGVMVEGAGGHAMTITGYSLQSSRHLTSEDAVPNSPNRIGLRIDELYVHDDGVGPFAKMVVKSKAVDPHHSSTVYFEGGWKDPVSGAPRRLLPMWAIVPVYHKIRLTFLDVQNWVTQLDAIVQAVLANYADAEWVSSLEDTSTVKERIRSSGLPEGTRTRVLFRQLPRFLWSAVLLIRGKRVVELLFDATGMARSLPILEAIFYDDQFRKTLQPLLAAKVVRDALDEQFVEFLESAAS